MVTDAMLEPGPEILRTALGAAPLPVWRPLEACLMLQPRGRRLARPSAAESMSELSENMVLPNLDNSMIQATLPVKRRPRRCAPGLLRSSQSSSRGCSLR